VKETPERPFLIMCVSSAQGDPTSHDGMYLCRYEPEAHDGRGLVEWSMSEERAIQFPTLVAAREAWMCVPRTRPTRDDGHPNRPLTAYTVSIQRRQD